MSCRLTPTGSSVTCQPEPRTQPPELGTQSHSLTCPLNPRTLPSELETHTHSLTRLLGFPELPTQHSAAGLRRTSKPRPQNPLRTQNSALISRTPLSRPKKPRTPNSALGSRTSPRLLPHPPNHQTQNPTLNKWTQPRPLPLSAQPTSSTCALLSSLELIEPSRYVASATNGPLRLSWTVGQKAASSVPNMPR